MAPISLTLTFDTAEQAQHVLEAYAEARGLTSGNIPAYMPVGNGNAQAAAGDAPSPSIPTYTPGMASGGANTASASAGNAPASGAAQSSTSPASTTEVDARGVPWHADHHSSSKKQTAKGVWQRRRNGNGPAADAYEAAYVGNGNSKQHSAPSGSTNPAQAATAKLPAAPKPVGPTWVGLMELWNTGCENGWIFTTDQEAIQHEFGVSHPVGEDVMNSPNNKLPMVFARLTQLKNERAAA